MEVKEILVFIDVLFGIVKFYGIESFNLNSFNIMLLRILDKKIKVLWFWNDLIKCRRVFNFFWLFY